MPAAAPIPLARRLLALLVALLVTPLVWLLRLTWHVRVVGPVPPEGALYAYWHGDQLALSAASVRPTLLISRSADGEWASRVARWLGYRVVRGSTSRGAVAGALGLARELRAGGDAGLAVDGPRGPRERTGEGASRLARCGGAPLVPVAVACSRGLRLRSWDRMLIPAPFADVVVVYGAPLAEGSLQQGLERCCAVAAGGCP